MVSLPATLQAWNSADFSTTLKQELEALESAMLPLLQASTRGGVPDERSIQAMLLHATESRDRIQAKVGIFFNEILAGCSCGDEPMSLQSYCELLDKQTAEVEFILPAA